MKIWIDAGHGGKDSGAVNGNHRESVYALAIAQKLGELLQKRGISVRYTRTDDIFVALQTRTSEANTWGADGFVSVHLNSADNKNASGIETLAYTAENPLARQVQAQLIAATDAVNRGVKARSDLYVLRHTNMPAILVETGFISNDQECGKLAGAVYQCAVARAIADGICSWAGITVPKNIQNTMEKEETMTIYKTLTDVPAWAQSTVQKLVNKGALQGNENGNLNLEHHMLRGLVINDRMGVYGK